MLVHPLLLTEVAVVTQLVTRSSQLDCQRSGGAVNAGCHCPKGKSSNRLNWLADENPVANRICGQGSSLTGRRRRNCRGHGETQSPACVAPVAGTPTSQLGRADS